MASQFIGLNMLVELRSPKGFQVQGTVSSIVPGQSLTLRNVTALESGKRVPELTITVGDIVTLTEFFPAENIALTQPAMIPRSAIPSDIPMAPTPPQHFEDPAILSMDRIPLVQKKPVNSNQASATMNRTDSQRTTTSYKSSVRKGITPDLGEIEKSMRQVGIEHVGEPVFAAPVVEGILDDAEPDIEVPPKLTQPKRANRRRGKGRRTNDDDLQGPEVTPAKPTSRSQGWRKTPLLEPNPSFQPFATLKRTRKGNDRTVVQNGWQTEDATDVQEMGDFDFAGGQAKFDKSTIFKQMQAEDSIAESDRLVGHNRLQKAKPGTAGGKNLHYTENVLGTPNGSVRSKKDAFLSEASESEEGGRASQKDTGSGRASRSKLIMNRNLKPTSRKGSAGPVTMAQPVRALSTPASKASFHLVPSDRRCEPISALQMLNLENIADNDFGLTEDMMTENAGRGIAEVVLSALNTGGRGLTQGKSSIVPVVVVFAGNNKSGLRALAAARHLRNHGLSVVACVLGLERETELLAGLRRQLKVFRGFGGKVLGKVELLEHVKTMTVPIDLIIDGLLGLTISFEELRTGDQATAYELIEWANRSKAAVLAIDIPTGIDPTTGKVSIIDGRRLYIHARFVVAMGAPKRGLLEAMALGEGLAVDEGIAGNEWQLFVADLGLGTAVWKKAGTRVRRGVEFEGSWVLGMRFQGVVE